MSNNHLFRLSAQNFVTPRINGKTESIRPSRGNVQQTAQRMQETYDDISSMPPVPRGPSRVDTLRWKIKTSSEENEELRAKLYSMRSKARDKIMKLPTFYRDMYSGTSRPFIILLKSFRKNNY